MSEDVVVVWEACEDGPVMRLVAREQWEAVHRLVSMQRRATGAQP